METVIKNRRRAGIFAFVALVAVALLALAPFLVGMSNSGAAATSAPVSPTPTASAEECAGTWPIVQADHTSNRWFYEGIASIKDATTNEEAQAAAYDWQEKVRQVPYLQAAAAKALLGRDVDVATLTGSNGCVTQAAVDLDLEIGVALASSKVSVGEAPVTGVNTGVVDGVVVSDSTPGVSGDRKAIQIVLSDGRTVWVMARCGNIVTETPSYPSGPTDNPPKPTCPPEMPNGTWPVCKDEPTNDPYNQGNAPVGGGPNYDPGPGEYIPPEDMEPAPEAPYVPPAPPAPEPPAQNPGNPAPVPTRDPAPAPKPEPSAPAPTNPVGPSDPGGGCAIPPGWASCTSPV